LVFFSSLSSYSSSGWCFSCLRGSAEGKRNRSLRGVTHLQKGIPMNNPSSFQKPSSLFRLFGFFFSFTLLRLKLRGLLYCSLFMAERIRLDRCPNDKHGGLVSGISSDVTV
jgi:hypothetical protein